MVPGARLLEAIRRRVPNQYIRLPFTTNESPSHSSSYSHWPWYARIIAVPVGFMVFYFATYGILHTAFPNYYDPPIPRPPFLDPSTASRAIQDLFARQSRTVQQARARYSLRTGRAPPERYDEWFEFATKGRCLIDDYDQIARDFAPFYEREQIDPGSFRRMVEKVSAGGGGGRLGVKALSVWNGRIIVHGWRIGIDWAWRHTLRRVSLAALACFLINFLMICSFRAIFQI